MRVLVACEFSGAVRDAFARRGHDAWSCDLLPTESPGQHIQGDVLKVINDGWDIIIAHPPCTYLSGAAHRVWNAPGRAELREEAHQFVRAIWLANCPRMAVENPVGDLNTNWMKPSQVIEPFDYGHSARKRTCLWLRNLPLLRPTRLVGLPAPISR